MGVSIASKHPEGSSLPALAREHNIQLVARFDGLNVLALGLL